MAAAKPKSTLGGDALTLTVSRVMVSLLGLVTSMLLARFRTLEEYGTYSQIIMVVDLTSTILLMGIPNSINYFMAKAESAEDQRRFMSVYLLLTTVLSLLITGCSYAALPLVTVYFKNPLLRNFAYVFIVYPWSSLMINSLGSTCVVCGQANRLIYFNLAQSSCSILLLLLAKACRLSFSLYLMLSMCLLILLSTAAIVWIRRIVGNVRLCIDTAYMRRIFAFSVPIGLAGAVGTLNGELDKLLIGYYFSTEDYAIFTNAARQLPVTMLTDSLTAVLLPCMVRLLKLDQRQEVVKLWKNSINIAFFAMCLIAGGLIVFAPDVMTLFYSAKYATSEGVAVFRIYSSVLLLRFTYWGIVLNATGKTKFILYSSIVTLALNLVGNVIFYHLFGFVGPAISTLIVTIVIALSQLYFTCVYLKIGLFSIFPWLDMLRMFVQTLLLGSIFWLIRYRLLTNVTDFLSVSVSMGLGGVWAVVYLLINRRQLITNWHQLNSGREPS